MSFSDDLRKLCIKAGAKAEIVVRKTALELQAQMIERSPVDTGRFKSNWACGIGEINYDTNAAAGSAAIGRTMTVLDGWKPGQTIFLTNSLVYAARLDRGWSKQAPLGITSLVVQNYDQAIKKAVSEIK